MIGRNPHGLSLPNYLHSKCFQVSIWVNIKVGVHEKIEQDLSARMNFLYSPGICCIHWLCQLRITRCVLPYKPKSRLIITKSLIATFHHSRYPLYFSVSDYILGFGQIKSRRKNQLGFWLLYSWNQTAKDRKHYFVPSNVCILCHSSFIRWFICCWCQWVCSSELWTFNFHHLSCWHCISLHALYSRQKFREAI